MALGHAGLPGDAGVMTQYEIHAEVMAEQPTAVTRATVRVQEIGPWLARTYGAVGAVLSAQGAGPAGPPFARYRRLAEGRFEVEAGFPVATAIDAADGVTPSALPASLAASVIHVGPYDQMEPAYGALAGWISEHGGEPAGEPWEIYFSDPDRDPDPATWRTQIVQPYHGRATGTAAASAGPGRARYSSSA